jgi:preprotein translocase SecE subunit
MARDRKRAKQRQRRRAGQQGQRKERTGLAGLPEAGPADPLGQAAPDAELAELAESGLQEPGAPVGRPLEEKDYPHHDELEDADVIEEVEAEEAGEAPGGGGGRRGRRRRGGGSDEGRGPDGPAPAPAAPSGRELSREGNRFVNFLRACMAELRRVQWPDRKQVGQATAVVLVFVVVAGGYLGLLDAVFSRLVNAIL